MDRQDCALCFRSFKILKTKPSHSGIEKLKAVCGTYIKSEISRTNNNYNWDSLWMRDNPLCPTCNDQAEHLLSLDDRIQQIQKELTDFVKLFCSEILKYHQEKIEMEDSSRAQFATIINQRIKEEIYSHSDDSSSYGNGWSDTVDTDEDSNSTPTINPEIKEEKQKNFYSDDSSSSNEKPVLCHLEDISSRVGRPKRKAAMKSKYSRYKISSSDENMPSEDEFVPIIQSSKRQQMKNTKKEIKSNLKSPKTKPTAQTVTEWKCKICSETFSRTIITERRHMRIFHPEEVKIKSSISCDICQETFEGPVLPYEIHCLEHKGELPFECQLCHRKFTSIQNYTDHYSFTVCGERVMIENSGGEEKTFNCKTCDKDFCANYLLLLHRLSHINFTESPFTCELCGKPFPVDKRGNFLVEKHFISHTKELPYPCDICGKRYGYLYSLEQHRLSHKGKTSNCGDCGSTFTNRNALYRHKRYLRCPKQKNDVKTAVELACDICGHKYRTQKGLEKHKEVVHNREKIEVDVSKSSEKFHCDICDLDFMRKANYTKHLKSHTEENPFQCANADCQQKFRVFYDLKEHYNINPKCKSVKDAKHDKYKHKCKVCGKRERTNVSLRMHEMTHTGEKPHLCDICGKSFIREDRLKQHKQKHDISYMENRLSCRSCPFKCKSLKGLLIHYKESSTCNSKVQETKKHKCDICDSRFHTKLNLMVHSKHKHQGEDFDAKVTKSLKCKTCQKVFYLKHQLLRHEKTHEKSKGT